MYFRFLILVPALFVIFYAPDTRPQAGVAFYDTDLNHDLCREKMVEVLNVRRSGNIEVKVSRNEEYTCQLIEISDGNRTLFQDAMIGGYFYLGPDAEHGQPFREVTGSNSKNLVISYWTGGAHCCFALRIFDIEDGLDEIAFLETGNYMPTFVDLDGDGIFEIHVMDDFLAYQFSSFAASATADVILKYIGGKYVVAPEFMVKPPTDLNSLQNEIADWRALIQESGDIDQLPYPFMTAVTDLIFSGHRETAERLIDITWPASGPSKNEFLQEYEEALTESKFYADFRQSIEQQD